MFRLRTLGSASVEGEAPITGRSSGRRRLALLALLAVARERGMTRDKVLSFLWAERDAERARHALSQLLYAIRGELSDDVVIAGMDDLRLNSAMVASDVAEFEDCVAAGADGRAAEIYTGPFLDGFFVADAPEFEQWAEQQRDRLARMYASVLERAAESSRRAGDHARAVELWRRRAVLEPLSGRIAHCLMQALATAGDLDGAIQHSRVHSALLEHELNAKPDPAVAALAAQLRQERASVAAETSMRSAAVVAVPALETSVGASTPPPIRQWTSPVVRGRSMRAAIVAALSLVAAVSLGAAVLSAYHQRTVVTSTDRRIVIGAIQSPDPILGLAVREALRAELESERAIRVTSESDVAASLALMRMSVDTPLTASVAIDLAQRRGVPFAIVGTATPLGTGVQLVVDLLDASTGGSIATVTQRPSRKEDVIPAVTRLASALRSRVVGAPLGGARPALPAVTTSSLEALRDYALARQAALRLDRPKAIALLEAALAHDSLFAIAHYVVGDLLWYVDQQSRSDVHLNAALRLSDRLPLRERLIVRARHEQLVRDRPDSALAYWQLLLSNYPDEMLAYEGMIWAYVALGRNKELALTTEAAVALDSTSRFNVRMRYLSLLGTGDTVGALRVAHLAKALLPNAEADLWVEISARRRDYRSALRMLDSAHPVLANAAPMLDVAATRQVLLLELGRFVEARREMEALVDANTAQYPHRALLFQAHAEIAMNGSTDSARSFVRRASALIARSDIYPPAVARLTELNVTAAARLGDIAAISAARRLLVARDASRGLHSFRVALMTIDACTAYARGDMFTAARLAGRSRVEIFHGRAVADVTMLEADARAALGDRVGARALYHKVSEMGPPWTAIADQALARQP